MSCLAAVPLPVFLAETPRQNCNACRIADLPLPFWPEMKLTCGLHPRSRRFSAAMQCLTVMLHQSQLSQVIEQAALPTYQLQHCTTCRAGQQQDMHQGPLQLAAAC